MVKLIKRYLGALMVIGGVLLIAWWFISSFMAEAEDINLLIGVAYTFIGLLLSMFGWHMWRSNMKADEKGTGWICGECGNRVRKNDKFCSKCGAEFK